MTTAEKLAELEREHKEAMDEHKREAEATLDAMIQALYQTRCELKSRRRGRRRIICRGKLRWSGRIPFK